MSSSTISSGVVHTVPLNIKKIFKSHDELRDVWNSLTPLARNEWICWITSAKQEETQNRRTRIMSENLLKGKRRPCCWAGCPHREKK